MKIPLKYEDLTVSQYMAIEALKFEELSDLDRAVKRVSILTDKSIEQVEEMRGSEVKELLTKAMFLSIPIHHMPIKSKVFLGTKCFKANVDKYKYSVAQHTDFATHLKIAEGVWYKCLPELLAITHLEFGITGFDYKSENNNKNIELFKGAKLGDVLGAVFFYSARSEIYTNRIANCLKEQQEVLASFRSEIANDKEFQSSLKTSVGNIQ